MAIESSLSASTWFPEPYSEDFCKLMGKAIVGSAVGPHLDELRFRRLWMDDPGGLEKFYERVHGIHRRHWLLMRSKRSGKAREAK